MLKLQVIGNLGADAEFKSSNGKEFLTFRVADTRKYADADGVVTEVTTWVGCIMDKPSGSLAKFLTKGTKVYVEGLPRFRTYKATKNGTTDYFVSVDLSVNFIQLCGGTSDDKDKPF